MTLPPIDANRSERHLLASVHRWARTNGWRPRWPESRRDGMWAWVNGPQSRTRPHLDAVRVTFDGRQLQVTRSSGNAGWYAVATVRASSVVQAVDVLVAVGILPPFLSSAYALAVERHAELIECLEEDLARRDHRIAMSDQTIAGLQLSPTGGAL